AVAGHSAKAEVPLGDFYKRHLHPRIGGSYAELLQGLFTPEVEGCEHAVQSLDWYHPTLGEIGLTTESKSSAAERRQRLSAARQAAETRARQALAGSPKLLRRFERLLANAQRFQPLGEEQISYWTLGWPVMRRALARIGAELVRQGVIAEAEQVYFLRREEVRAALAGSATPLAMEADPGRLPGGRGRRLCRHPSAGP